MIAGRTESIRLMTPIVIIEHKIADRKGLVYQPKFCSKQKNISQYVFQYIKIPSLRQVILLNGDKKHIISVPVVYDWVSTSSSQRILIPLNPTKPSVLKTDVAYFYAMANGIKREFKDEDEVIEYGGGQILDPVQVSCINVFVNGILQNPLNYTINKGQLHFNTEDVPEKNVLITIQFISIYNTPL